MVNSPYNADVYKFCAIVKVVPYEIKGEHHANVLQRQ